MPHIDVIAVASVVWMVFDAEFEHAMAPVVVFRRRDDRYYPDCFSLRAVSGGPIDDKAVDIDEAPSPSEPT